MVYDVNFTAPNNKVNQGVPSWTFMFTHALRHSISVTVHDTAASCLPLATHAVSGSAKRFRLVIIPIRFSVNHRKEKSCVGFRKQISMTSDDVKQIIIQNEA